VTYTSSSAPTVQSFARRRFRWRGAVGGLLLVPAMMVSLFSAPILAADSWTHLALQIAAWSSFVAGATFRFWATLYVGGRKERELVTDGPYSLCRHPLYLGSLLLGISGALFIESPLLLVALAIVALIYVRTTIPVEEAVLRTRHRGQHEAYVREVPRLWPRSHVVRTPATITVDVHRLWLECLRASRWMWLPLLGAVFTYLRTFGWWPRLLRLF
jgi:protein-S-isoprenylcysteine O-methyltransferase Ste14